MHDGTDRESDIKYQQSYRYTIRWPCVEGNNVDGATALMTKFCDPEEYDYPVYEQVATAVQSFQEMIRL